jgi:uncharacterized protein
MKQASQGGKCYPVTDFHTHAFPDTLAERAIRTLEGQSAEVKATHDGRVSSLLESMDRAGIARSVVCSIATRPEQFEPILRWSRGIRSERIIPLPSIHPLDPDPVTRVREVHRAGFPGVKLHPYYQDFVLDDPSMFPLYQELATRGMLLVFHSGFDIAFPWVRRCDPRRSGNLLREFPTLRLVATHMGGWMDWDEVRRHLLGREIFLEISFAMRLLPADEVRSMILGHPREFLLFGTDSPWQDQGEEMHRLRELHLGQDCEEAILSRNAERLLDPYPAPRGGIPGQ